VTLAPGSDLGPRVIESVSADRMRALAEVLDDPNPIHLDPEAVRALGLGDRVVNQGPANFAYVLDMLRAELPRAELRDLRVRLLANVHAGDRVIAGGRVESSVASVDRRELACSIWLEIDGGVRAVDGTATLIVPED
jgi:3-hydroxybutyryl-CoA dehydratase